MDAWQDIEKAEEQFLNTLADLGGLAPETAGMLRHCARLIKQMKARHATPKPAGAVPLPYSWVPDEIDGDEKVCTLKSAIAYGDAREAAGRAVAVAASVHSLIALWRGNTRADKTVTGAEWNGFRSALTRCAAELEGALAAPIPQQPAAEGDDIAVDRFAEAMKEKMAAARAKGRGGWEGPTCNAQMLSDMLRNHVEKGDPRDVANFCMMLWNRGEAIQAAEGAGREAVGILSIGPRIGPHPFTGWMLTRAGEHLPEGEYRLYTGPTPAADASRVTDGCYIVRYNADGEFGQKVGWLYKSGGDPCVISGKPVYVWRPISELLEQSA